jgi:hypothetical protein
LAVERKKSVEDREEYEKRERERESLSTLSQ